MPRHPHSKLVPPSLLRRQGHSEQQRRGGRTEYQQFTPVYVFGVLHVVASLGPYCSSVTFSIHVALLPLSGSTMA